jgi:hypothetical protein
MNPDFNKYQLPRFLRQLFLVGNLKFRILDRGQSFDLTPQERCFPLDINVRIKNFPPNKIPPEAYNLT